MGSNCSSTFKKKDKYKLSIENENELDNNNAKQTSENIKENLNVQQQYQPSQDADRPHHSHHHVIANQQTINLDESNQNNPQNENFNHHHDEVEMINAHENACITDSNLSDQNTSSTTATSITTGIKRNCYDAVFTSPANYDHIVVISNDRNELCIFDIKKEQIIRTINNINQPKDLRFIDNTKAIVLCNRELNVYDLEKGELIVKLKGVMNQKMPFFGLHNQDYAVALSRNRMYVNMINLKTGNLETTFKVGEDRFLNSLLVSSNGKICVCGDETQKPFPLLVWDLVSRKLIYDLRIPNHEFVTTFSAISDDGHYVVCVCKEVCSNAPNFIVVYDLQNGTLFKKWKPDCSTNSITISSHDSCVINGLENKQILVWDLSTGTIRHTLEGHRDTIRKLSVADDGKYLLSNDNSSAIKVWDLSSGLCLKEIQPGYLLSCCLLSKDGQILVLCPDNDAKVNILNLSEC